MDLVDKFEHVDESSEENGEDNMGLILEESEFVGCDDADDEATGEEGLHYQYTPKVYCNDRSAETVTYQLLQIDENDSREIEVAIPNSIKQPVQLLASPVSGQFYVISNDDTLSQTMKSYTPRVSQVQVKSPNSSGESVPKKRDDKRRVTHNEVERRRRDKINSWITVLGKLLPENKTNPNEVSDSKHTFETQVNTQKSKGGILSRACDYILELKETNKTLDRRAIENKQLLQEVKNLRQIVNQLKKQNSLLKCRISESNGKAGT